MSPSHTIETLNRTSDSTVYCMQLLSYVMRGVIQSFKNEKQKLSIRLKYFMTKNGKAMRKNLNKHANSICSLLASIRNLFYHRRRGEILFLTFPTEPNICATLLLHGLPGPLLLLSLSIPASHITLSILLSPLSVSMT